MRSPIANHRFFITMTHRFFRLALALLATFLSATGAMATTMQLASAGTGQVLLFPYYTARNGTVSLVSIVNSTIAANAVRVNIREARGGFVVAQLNVYMSAKDVWTAAIVNDTDGAMLVSSDKSCTAPAIGNGLPLSNAEYRADLLSFGADLEPLGSRDRTREGYVEVIEIASISNATALGKDVTHLSGVPRCRLIRPTPAVGSTPELPPAIPLDQLSAPTGGLYGTLSFVNVNQGMLASTPATAIENFWLTGPDAPAPRLFGPVNAVADLTSGKNTSVSLTVRGEPYTARFANSIDAVSAILMTSTANSEYAATQDGVIGTILVATMPTKPYYTRGGALGPFTSRWNQSTAQSCDTTAIASFSREEEIPPPYEGGVPPPSPPSNICFVANPILVGTKGSYVQLQTTDDATYLGSSLTVGFLGVQAGSTAVLKPGKEGGWASLYWLGKLSTVDASVYRRNAVGTLAWTPVSMTLTGLPVIGFTMAQSAYKTGSPQQNYADATPLRTDVTVTEGK